MSGYGASEIGAFRKCTLVEAAFDMSAREWHVEVAGLNDDQNGCEKNGA